MYCKTKIHRGPLANCKTCMAEVARQDPVYAAMFSKTAAAAEKLKKKKANRGR
jgi:hypothetical protein